MGCCRSTLVASLAEFGRTPKVNPAGGRDHWPQCWTVSLRRWRRPGRPCRGRSDAIGAVPADRPVEPAEIVATVYHSLGLGRNYAARSYGRSRPDCSTPERSQLPNCSESPLAAPLAETAVAW